MPYHAIRQNFTSVGAMEELLVVPLQSCSSGFESFELLGVAMSHDAPRSLLLFKNEVTVEYLRCYHKQSNGKLKQLDHAINNKSSAGENRNEVSGPRLRGESVTLVRDVETTNCVLSGGERSVLVLPRSENSDMRESKFVNDIPTSTALSFLPA